MWQVQHSRNSRQWCSQLSRVHVAAMLLSDAVLSDAVLCDATLRCCSMLLCDAALRCCAAMLLCDAAMLADDVRLQLEELSVV